MIASLSRAKLLRDVDRPVDTGVPTALPTVSTSRNHGRKKKSCAISIPKARPRLSIFSATMYCLLLRCLLADARPQRAIAESMVPRARPKGRALVRAQWCYPISKGGNDPDAVPPVRGKADSLQPHR